MGVTVTSVGDGLAVYAQERLRSIDVATLPYPGIATDYKPLIVTMLSVADGVGIVTENLYPGRFRYVEELQRLEAVAGFAHVVAADDQRHAEHSPEIFVVLDD